jgi:hypothetical protein
MCLHQSLSEDNDSLLLVEPGAGGAGRNETNAERKVRSYVSLQILWHAQIADL